jgi:hypothetical protein
MIEYKKPIMTEEDELFIESLLQDYQQGIAVDELEDGTPITIPTATYAAAKRLKELLAPRIS